MHVKISILSDRLFGISHPVCFSTYYNVSRQIHISTGKYLFIAYHTYSDLHNHKYSHLI